MDVSSLNEEVEPTVELIILARLYDLLGIIARGINPTEAEQVMRAHEEGILFMPPPSYREVIHDEVAD